MVPLSRRVVRLLAANQAAAERGFSPSNLDNVGHAHTPAIDSQIVMREINLAGDTIREISRDTLNDRIASAGFNLSVQTLHHDVLALPNGHIILIVNSTRDFTDLPGLPGTTTVLGDALVDLDPNLQPVWVWNSFDHLDVNRA